MQQERPSWRPSWPAPRQATWLAIGYAAVMLYSSTIIGPAGPNFVARDPAEALQAFLAIRFVAHGSDQRADWIGNLLMLAPFGFLVTATVWPRRGRTPRFLAGLLAMLTCVTTILAIKYLQLFFPPRTVTLNYVTAQTLGALCGCAGFAFWHERLSLPMRRHDPVAGLVLALRLYLGALLIFLLMPLDFALNATDIQTRVARLPETVMTLPGASRPLIIRVAALVAASLAFVPVGVLLTFSKTRSSKVDPTLDANHPLEQNRLERDSVSLRLPHSSIRVHPVQRGLLAVVSLGLMITTGLFALSTMVLGATPALASILYRLAGIVIGTLGLRWLVRQDTNRLLRVLRALAVWLAVPYVGAVLLVAGLLSPHWQSPTQAVSQAYPLGLLPLFDYYIVSKAEAAKNVVVHLLMYLPIGVALWLRKPGRPIGGRAFLLASVLSLVVELGRYLRPGLEGDINAVPLAGFAAVLGTWLAPGMWSFLVAVTRQSNGQSA